MAQGGHTKFALWVNVPLSACVLGRAPPPPLEASVVRPQNFIPPPILRKNLCVLAGIRVTRHTMQDESFPSMAHFAT